MADKAAIAKAHIAMRFAMRAEELASRASVLADLAIRSVSSSRSIRAVSIEAADLDTRSSSMSLAIGAESLFIRPSASRALSSSEGICDHLSRNLSDADDISSIPCTNTKDGPLCGAGGIAGTTCLQFLHRSCLAFEEFFREFPLSEVAPPPLLCPHPLHAFSSRRRGCI